MAKRARPRKPKRPPGKRGRSPRSIEEAREFGRLVELERKTTPNATLDVIFERIHRRNPRRWGSRATLFRLWALYKKEQADPAARRAAELAAYYEAWKQAYLERGSDGPKVRNRRADTGYLGLKHDYDD